MAFVVSNVPAVVEGAQAIGDLVFKAAGVGYQVVPVDPGTADITPQLQSAVSGGASALGVVGDVTLCSSFLARLRHAGPHIAPVRDRDCAWTRAS